MVNTDGAMIEWQKMRVKLLNLYQLKVEVIQCSVTIT